MPAKAPPARRRFTAATTSPDAHHHGLRIRSTRVWARRCVDFFIHTIITVLADADHAVHTRVASWRCCTCGAEHQCVIRISSLACCLRRVVEDVPGSPACTCNCHRMRSIMFDIVLPCCRVSSPTCARSPTEHGCIAAHVLNISAAGNGANKALEHVHVLPSYVITHAWHRVAVLSCISPNIRTCSC